MNKVKSNWTAKLFALIIAIFLWSYVMSEVNPVITKTIRDVNVRLENMESLDRQELVIMSPEAATVNIEVSGPKSDIDKFTSSNIVAEVDLTGYSEGEIKIPVYVKLQNTASNIKIENWDSREILFKIDKIIEKEIGINIETVGEIVDGHILEAIEKKPQNLVVKGARSLVDQVSEARAIVDLTDKTSSTSMSVPVQLLNGESEEVSGVEKDPGIIDVSIDISKTKTLPIKLETINELPENINIKDIKIYPISVKVKGKEELEELKEIKTKAIDINDLIGKSSVDVELAFPDGVKLVDSKQKISIRYSVEEILEKEYNFSSNEIKIKNLDEEYKLKDETIPSEVNIVLKGPKSIFDNITKDNLKLYIDLKDMQIGKNELDIKLEDIQGLVVKSIDPEKTTIELELTNTE